MNVTNSLSGKRWIISQGDARTATALMQRFGVPDCVGQIMAARGIMLDNAPDFLEPTLRNLLPDPFHLKDMEKACARMAKALMENEKICVFGDYDVDGATSSALLLRYAAALGKKIDVYIPDRLSEGYGPNVKAMQMLAASGTKLIITVDCGITAHEPIKEASEAGADVIVLDHHVAEPALPPACAVVNPNRLDETSPHRNLAAVGVTFLFLVGLHKTLRAQNYFSGKLEPDLMAELDLVALGTVADMVALTGINRAFVKQGLRVMGQTRNTGLQALLRVAGSSGPCDTYTAGFLLGPRVNAGGRVGKSDLGVRLLSLATEAEAEKLSQQLNALNEERKTIEQFALDEAFAAIGHEESACVLAQSDTWHPGVIGLIASRLKDRYNRPSFVTSFMSGVGKGSCRSVKGVDIGTCVIAARQEGLLVNGGGHAMAAGYTVSRETYPAFADFMEKRIAQTLEETPLEPTLVLDGVLSVGGVTVELAEQLQQLAPFGMGNPEPRFGVMEAVLVRAEPVGKNHLRLSLKDDAGNFLTAMAWRALDNALGATLIGLEKGTRLHVAGHIRLNSYAMRTQAQLIVDDVALA